MVKLFRLPAVDALCYWKNGCVIVHNPKTHLRKVAKADFKAFLENESDHSGFSMIICVKEKTRGSTSFGKQLLETATKYSEAWFGVGSFKLTSREFEKKIV
jgi:hypothetical protein